MDKLSFMSTTGISQTGIWIKTYSKLKLKANLTWKYKHCTNVIYLLPVISIKKTYGN